MKQHPLAKSYLATASWPSLTKLSPVDNVLLGTSQLAESYQATASVYQIGPTLAAILPLHKEEVKHRLHVLTAHVVLFLLLITTCTDSPRSSASLLVWQLWN